jgi:hypothetical protein
LFAASREGRLSRPQWLTCTGDILTVGLITGAVSFSLR